MYIFITVLIVIAAILLTLLVLVQNSKGGGLAAGFASGAYRFLQHRCRGIQRRSESCCCGRVCYRSGRTCCSGSCG